MVHCFVQMKASDVLLDLSCILLPGAAAVLGLLADAWSGLSFQTLLVGYDSGSDNECL
jgi:hypothetical protein